MSKKIVHVCLCGPVTDGWTYQDNLLPKYHKQLGYEVVVITSQWIWGGKGEVKKDSRSEYINEYGIKTIRLPIKANKSLEYKFKKYPDLIKNLENENPDILFIHDCQFLDIWNICCYLKCHKYVKAYVDNHADFSNSGKNFLSREILHKKIWRAGAKAIEPYITKFYGVLPARVDFLRNMYKLPNEKTELLVMGADDDKVKEAQDLKKQEALRSQLKIKNSDFVIITGGKIDYAKRQTLLLMQAVNDLRDVNIKLIVFGSVEDDMQQEFKKLCDNDDRIINLGWLHAEDTYQYFAISDLAVFPGRHSVIWEQAAGQGIPMVIKYWEGTDHVDVGGNVKFLYRDSVEEIREVLKSLMDKGEEYQKMLSVAKEVGVKNFSYKDISERSVRE